MEKKKNGRKIGRKRKRKKKIVKDLVQTTFICQLSAARLAANGINLAR